MTSSPKAVHISGVNCIVIITVDCCLFRAFTDTMKMASFAEEVIFHFGICPVAHTSGKFP